MTIISLLAKFVFLRAGVSMSDEDVRAVEAFVAHWASVRLLARVRQQMAVDVAAVTEGGATNMAGERRAWRRRSTYGAWSLHERRRVVASHYTVFRCVNSCKNKSLEW